MGYMLDTFWTLV
uniref:Uncharacterized protein n=1 Tax=Arundo donax TaxID=35708 RepID=A0A0A8ZQV8_ARUDO